MTSDSHPESDSKFSDEMARAAGRIYSGITEWYVDAFFDDLSDSDWLDELRHHLRDGDRVLDAGAGPGNFAQYLASEDLLVVAADISYGMARTSHSLVPQAPAVVADMRDLPIGSKQFDAVLSAYSLMHVPAPVDRRVLQEFPRVVRPNGLLQLMVKTGDGPHAFTASSVPGVHGHLQLFDSNRVMTMLNTVGFTPIVSREKLSSSPHEFDHPKLMTLSRRSQNA